MDRHPLRPHPRTEVAYASASLLCRLFCHLSCFSSLAAASLKPLLPLTPPTPLPLLPILLPLHLLRLLEAVRTSAWLSSCQLVYPS